ncbi:transcription factor TFIIIB subunit BDP1 [Aspergillus stella-maris]|uniref:transcription factor TFIIIB subunit BDP1 n=1 Tax=Aspergillus stella-maris TaxID=1810926 RepID=UPI003CCD0DB7
MKSFSSSVISKFFIPVFCVNVAQILQDKSGKKFAPKAPARRAAPAPSAPPRAPSRRPSVASQASASHPPAAPSETATPELSQSHTSVVEPPAAADSATAVPSSVAPTIENVPNETAIPIPAPKRKASVAIPIPQPLNNVPRVSVSHQLPPSAPATTEPVVEEARPSDNSEEIVVVQPQSFQNEDPSATTTVAPHEDEVVPEVRPSKRLRTTIESTSTATLNLPSEEPVQIATPPATQTPARRERTQSRDESEVPSTVRRGSTAKPAVRRASRATSDDAGKVKKERKKRTRKREPTPEGAELIEIAPTVMKMSDLCKDLRTGKQSRREKELRALEQAEAERKKAQLEEGREGTPVKKSQSDPSPKGEENGGTPNKASQAGPVMRIVNGEIVLDAASLQVDRHADAERNGDELEDVVENSLTRKINQATYGKRSKTESWDEDMTDLFYRGLRMFGTDFMVISKMFPGRSRRQIKLKFNNEERRDPQRIKDTLLGPREAIDINTYSEMTNTVYDDPRIIQLELDEEKKQIEEQHERDKKAQEDLLRNPDGLAGNDASADKAPAKPKRTSKKQALQAMGGGTEEILGSIDD